MFVYDAGDVIGFTFLAIFASILVFRFIKEILINAIESVKNIFMKGKHGTWRREKAELQLAIDAEKARHTEDYKDERIRAQDEEIATLKSEMAELRKCLKKAIELICDTYCESDNCDCCIRNMKWRKALEGANDQVAEGGKS